MRASIAINKRTIRYDLEPENDDKPALVNCVMAGRTCSVTLPSEVINASVHPDLAALSAILIGFPFIGSRLMLNTPVSSHFAEVFLKVTRKKIGPIDLDLEPRRPGAYSLPALAFSGGVDSTAALAIMPESTVSFFLDRKVADQKQTLYRKDAAKFACRSLRERGRRVYEIESDLEYIRDPVGFPVDFSNAVPAVVLADPLNLNSIAFGTIMESAYRVGHDHFMDYGQRSHYKLWSALFKAAGIPINLVTAGISEVGTSSIVINSGFSDIAQSCMRGAIGRPCFNCWKCFRKVLLDAILKKRTLDSELLELAFDIKEARRFLQKDLIKHQNVIEYIAFRYTGENGKMLALKDKVANHDGLNYLIKWYRKSAVLINDKYRIQTEKEICKYLNVMNDKEEQAIEAYDLRATLQSTAYKHKCQRFRALVAG